MGMDKRKIITWFQLAMINVSAITSLRNFPLTAEYGAASVVLFALASAFFFIPIALVSAELASSYQQSGGIYRWVKEAFGVKAGFLAIWFQSATNLAWFPTILSFFANMVAYVIDPELANNPWYNICVTIGLFWLLIFVALKGIKVSAWISSIGTVIGTVFPGIVIIVLGLVWMLGGKPLQISFAPQNWWPDLSHVTGIVFFVGILSGLSGMEMSANHVLNVKDPQRNYPKAIFMAAILVLILSTLGSLAIAVVVPAKEINLVNGVMQAFSAFFRAFGMSIWLPVIALLCAIGALTQMNTWVIGPLRGLLTAAEDGDLPKFFAKVNKAGMPVTLLYAQGGFVTLLSFAFLLFPTISSSYWILTALLGQLFFLMYLLMFAAILKLRRTQPHLKRPYCVPGGKTGVWIVSLLGIISSLFALFIGFLPPSQLNTGSTLLYVGFLLISLALLVLLPIWIVNHRKSFKKPTN